MNKKTSLFALAASAVLFTGIALSFLYKGLTRKLFITPLTALQSAALIIIAIIFSSVIILRFIAPFFFRNNADAESECEAPSLFGRYSDFGAWLFFALCLSALVAAPLADTGKYIGYAFIFAALSALCAVLSIVPCAEKLALSAERLPIAALLLSIIPGFGAGVGIFCTASSAVALREEKASRKQCLGGIASGIGGAFISAVIAFCLSHLLLLK